MFQVMSFMIPAAGLSHRANVPEQGVENKKPRLRGVLQSKIARMNSDGLRVFLVFRLPLRFGFRRLHLCLFSLSLLPFLFRQFCPVQGFELKAHGAPPSSELRVTQFVVLLFLEEC
jgi:hypothetical protein